MRRQWSITAAAIVCAFASQAAHACLMSVPLNLEDVKYADVVVVGRVTNYHIVRDEAFRRAMLANPKLPADLRRFYSDKTKGLMGDYAQFDVMVDEVLAGSAPARLSVTWDNSTFSEPPTMSAGSFLIALRKAGSAAPPLRGPSATILPDPDPSRLAILEAPCAGPFLFKSDSDTARVVRKMLEGSSK